MSNDNNPSLFEYEEYSQSIQADNTPVVCLGKEFPNDAARREYFRAELRKKLPELKKIEGFPIGEDDDIINLSDPPYYTACPNPWLNDFIAEWEKEKSVLESQGKRKKDFEVKEPYASDVSEGKYNSIYYKHPYHTKVPIAAIETYINHYTQPGDIIFDGFAGTGMSSVAAQLAKNSIKSISLDLSPIASYINYYYNYSASKQDISQLVNTIIPRLREEFGWMYETKHTDGSIGTISSIIWSDNFVCPTCGNEVNFWNNGVDIKNGKILEKIHCNSCGAYFSKNNNNKSFEVFYDEYINDTSHRIKISPMRLTYSINKNYYKEPDEYDFEILKRIEEYKIESWFPTNKIPLGEKTSDALKTGIKNVHHLYFKRTLIVLSALYKRINNPNLYGIITSIAFRINKRYALTYMSGKWGAGGGPTNGTYYIPSLIKELNIFDILDSAVKKCLNGFFPSNFTTAISTQSTTNVKIKDSSIDYIFTDPPFGNNFIYSELNFIWESWLKIFTDNKNESITSSFYKKDGDFYKHLMTRAFTEYYRILKPGKWLTVEFSNTKAYIWNILQKSLQDSGFVIVNVSGLDKKKGSYNAQISVSAVKQDLVVTCYKPTEKLVEKLKNAPDKSIKAIDFIEELLQHLPVHIEKENTTTAVIERSPKILYDRLISYYVQHGWPIPMDAQEFQKMLRNSFIERDGMFFTASQALEYEEKRKQTSGVVSMGIFIGSEADGIAWLNNKLQDTPMTYQDLMPEWMKDMIKPKTGDIIPELITILEENFISEDGRWRKPDPEKAADLEALRNKRMAKEFATYLEFASKPKAKRMKDCRLEVLRYGFKECYKQKDFKSIVLMGDHIQESLLQEDEVLLQYYDIALERV